MKNGQLTSFVVLLWCWLRLAIPPTTTRKLDPMLTLSKSPTTRAGKEAGSALINEAKTLIALSSAFPSLEEAFVERSSPKHRKACVEIIRKMDTDANAHAIAALLDVGNTSAFFQKFEGCFVLAKRAEADLPSKSPEELLRSLGIALPPSGA